MRPPLKRSKYGARKCRFEGESFDSQLELRRWLMLQDEERRRVIQNLRRQIAYPLCANKVKIGDYVADFVYLRNGLEIIEDAKGLLTPLCRWKLKHMAAQGSPVTLWPEPKPNARKARAKKAMS